MKVIPVYEGSNMSDPNRIHTSDKTVVKHISVKYSLKAWP